MSIEYIDIIETDPTDSEWPRMSSLRIKPDSLTVIGELPHGYEWRPRTNAQRDKMIAWLSTLSYKS